MTVENYVLASTHDLRYCSESQGAAHMASMEERETFPKNWHVHNYGADTQLCTVEGCWSAAYPKYEDVAYLCVDHAYAQLERDLKYGIDNGDLEVVLYAEEEREKLDAYVEAQA